MLDGHFQRAGLSVAAKIQGAVEGPSVKFLLMGQLKKAKQNRANKKTQFITSCNKWMYRWLTQPS